VVSLFILLLLIGVFIANSPLFEIAVLRFAGDKTGRSITSDDGLQIDWEWPVTVFKIKHLQISNLVIELLALDVTRVNKAKTI
jgi:hypothetical protein